MSDWPPHRLISCASDTRIFGDRIAIRQPPGALGSEASRLSGHFHGLIAVVARRGWIKGDSRAYAPAVDECCGPILVR
jgi:hypothetical protein